MQQLTEDFARGPSEETAREVDVAADSDSEGDSEGGEAELERAREDLQKVLEQPKWRK